MPGEAVGDVPQSLMLAVDEMPVASKNIKPTNANANAVDTELALTAVDDRPTATNMHDVKNIPDAAFLSTSTPALPSYSYDDLESRFDAKMSDFSAEQDKLMDEWNGWRTIFVDWAESGSAREESRGAKRYVLSALTGLSTPTTLHRLVFAGKEQMSREQAGGLE